MVEYTEQNFPGPYEIELLYIVDGLQHLQRLNMDVQGTPTAGDASSTITFDTRDGVGVNFESAIDDYLAIIDGLYNATDTAFVSATLSKYVAGTTAKDFISQYGLSIIGVSANPTIKAAQYTLTFGTQEGNGMRLVFMESVVAAQTKLPLSLVTGDFATLADFVVSTDNWILARDTSWPIVKQNGSGGQNERIWRERYR